eukprot:s477_g3.t1
MAQVAKQVASTQNFLVGLQQLPHYGELRAKQLDRLLGIIRASKLTLEQAAPVLSSLDQGIWDVESLGRLKSALADQTLEDTEDVEKRVKQQDYSALPHYVTEDLWLCFEKAEHQEDREKALEILCEMAGKLGLRNPTEETCAFLYVLAFTMHPVAIVYDCEKQSLLQRWKPIMKRHLKKFPSPVTTMKVLPEKVEECPQVFLREAFPNGWKRAKPRTKSLADIIRLGKTWPLRISHAVASNAKNAHVTPSAASVNVDVLGAAAAVARQTTLAVANSLVAREDVPGLKILKQADAIPAVTPKPVLPAILDKVPEAVASSLHGNKNDPQQMIDLLREDLEKEKQEKQEKGVGAKSKAKAAKSKGKPKATAKSSLKRPAASVAVMRRPAAAAAAEDPMHPEARRAALLDRIPRRERMLYADGCSRCKYRKFCTISCWARRGYS